MQNEPIYKQCDVECWMDGLWDLTEWTDIEAWYKIVVYNHRLESICFEP